MIELFDFEFYAPAFLRIQTKSQGLKPFKLRLFQKRFNKLVDTHKGPGRFIVLKPRQCGFSTYCAGKFTHSMMTREDYKGIMLADKSGRTDEVFNIYSRFVTNVDAAVKPMIRTMNTREILFDNPDLVKAGLHPGLRSGIKAETALDPNAGRSGTRSFAHLTEYAFYRYASEIDEGVQNSIPLVAGTTIIKESTANGMSGSGEAFFKQWEAATRGEYIYKPFFVSWYEVDDYQMVPDRDFKLTKEEKELVKLCPDITEHNLVWRRAKLSEYSSGKSIFTPEERFKQDFPSYPEEAFLNSGRPVFNSIKIKTQIRSMLNHPAPRIEFRSQKKWLLMYSERLTVWHGPEKGGEYVIGADIAEGVETGDYSCAKVVHKQTRRVVAQWHGHIDADHFGELLVDIAQAYNNAIIVPEINNMGITTLTAIKRRGYYYVYSREVWDELAKEMTKKLGWRTTRSNKLDMLSRLIAAHRDDAVTEYDVDTLQEMALLTRESDGDVELTGMDRVVALCLALVGLDQSFEPARVHIPTTKKRVMTETKDMTGIG